MARPKIYDEEEIIDKAIGVFWDKCYDATSADELLDAMGIGKGSFYLNFKGGKQELYERSLKQFAEKFHRRIEREMVESGDELGYVRKLFTAAANAPASNKNRGCYYGNALVQLTSKDTHTKVLAAELLKDLERIFVKAIRAAQEKGQISKDKNPAILGLHLSNFWNGINVTKRTQHTNKELLELVDINFKILE